MRNKSPVSVPVKISGGLSVYAATHANLLCMCDNTEQQSRKGEIVIRERLVVVINNCSRRLKSGSFSIGFYTAISTLFLAPPRIRVENPPTHIHTMKMIGKFVQSPQ